MEHIEKILRKAREGEKIVIDQQFKRTLKREILSQTKNNRVEEKQYPAVHVFWRRMMITAVPLLVTIVMFFYYYQGKTNPPVPSPAWSPAISDQLQDKEEKREAKIMDNRSNDSEPYSLQAPSSPSAGTALPSGKSENNDFQNENITSPMDKPDNNFAPKASTSTTADGFLITNIIGILIFLIGMTGIIVYSTRKK